MVEKDKISKCLVEKQLTQVQNLALHLYQSKLRKDAVDQTEELASATKRLRTEISVSVIKNKSGLVVAVSDTGIGISNEIIGKLFQIDQNITTTGTQNE